MIDSDRKMVLSSAKYLLSAGPFFNSFQGKNSQMVCVKKTSGWVRLNEKSSYCDMAAFGSHKLKLFRAKSFHAHLRAISTEKDHTRHGCDKNALEAHY